MLGQDKQKGPSVLEHQTDSVEIDINQSISHQMAKLSIVMDEPVIRKPVGLASFVGKVRDFQLQI